MLSKCIWVPVAFAMSSVASAANQDNLVSPAIKVLPFTPSVDAEGSPCEVDGEWLTEIGALSPSVLENESGSPREFGGGSAFEDDGLSSKNAREARRPATLQFEEDVRQEKENRQVNEEPKRTCRHKLCSICWGLVYWGLIAMFFYHLSQID